MDERFNDRRGFNEVRLRGGGGVPERKVSAGHVSSRRRAAGRFWGSCGSCGIGFACLHGLTRNLVF